MQNGNNYSLNRIFFCLSQGDFTGICHHSQTETRPRSVRPGELIETVGPCWSLLEGCSVPLAAGMEKVSPGIVMLLSKTRGLLLAASCNSACKSQMAAWDPVLCLCIAQMACAHTDPAFSISVGSPHQTLPHKSWVIPDLEQAPSPSALVPLPTLEQDKP